MATIPSPQSKGLSIAPAQLQPSSGPQAAGIGSATTITPQQATDAAVQQAIYKFPLDTPKYYTRIRVSDYSRQSLNTVGKLNNLTSFILPLPLNLIDVHQIDYTQAQIGFAGGGVAQQLANARPGEDTRGAQSVVGGVTAGLGGLLNLLGSGRGVNASNIGQIGEGIAQGTVAGATGIAQSLYGWAPNEFITILLRGPMYKRHALKFKLSPKSFAESEQIARIINLINNYAAPNFGPGGAFFLFPKIFEVAYLPNPGWLYKFKPAVVENFTVNYSGGGSPAFYRSPAQPLLGGNPPGDNPPESIEMQINLIELEYWMQGDFKFTNDPDDGARQ